MINLNVDEAYAFDYLSILDIKKQKNFNSYEFWNNSYTFLKNQFEPEKWNQMINSEEYKNILKANQLTFDAVDKAKTNEVTAQYVDFCNYQRHIAKENFQKKFFSKSLSEVKIGYDKYENKSTINN